jgi:hypothetical protein
MFDKALATRNLPFGVLPRCRSPEKKVRAIVPELHRHYGVWNPDVEIMWLT